MTHAFNRDVLSAKKVVPLIGAGLLLAAGQAWALTPAGTAISNKATVTYKDANGNQYSAQSNEAVVTVAEVYSATLQEDRTKQGAPGDTVYFSHTLSNTGNAADTYTLTSYEGTGTSGTAGSYGIYIDTNNNGLPDAGENAATSVAVAAGSQVSLILAVPVPSGASASDPDITATLAAVSDNSGSVGDLTNGSGGLDGADGTNTDTIDISADAVLVVNKSQTFDAANQEITYTLTLKNNGGRVATDVDIVDAIPANTTFKNVVSVNGLLGSNGDQYVDNTGTSSSLPASYSTANLAQLDESGIGVDLNSDGDTSDTALPGLHFIAASLAPNTTVSLVYTVTLDGNLSADTKIKNLFAAQGNLDGDSGSPEGPAASNTVIHTVAQGYAVDADDTDGGDGDADATDNDTFTVDSAPAGAQVVFYNVITNNGNGNDRLELYVTNDGGTGYLGSDTPPSGNPAFPSGTIFTFWNDTGNVQITDTNGDGNADTGSLTSGGNLKIIIKAQLPAGASGTGPYAFTLTATSAGDNTKSDTALNVLNAISAPAVDLANSHSADLADNGTVDADAYSAGSPSTTLANIAAGGEATFDLFLANESGNAQSFDLSAALPTGWSVQFHTVGVDADGDGTVENTTGAGSVATSTPNLPAGGIFVYQAKVTVSSDVAEARADHTDGSGLVSGAGTYPIVFTVTSTADASITDQKLDAVTVKANRNLSVTPDGTNQIQPGGSVDYPHVVSNDGNHTEEVELSAVNAATGWNNTTTVFVGTSCTATELSSLATGAQPLCDSAGNPVTVNVADSDSDGNPEITLAPGDKIKVRVTVFAPSNAADGAGDMLALAATNTDTSAPTSASASATDSTTATVGLVRLEKKVALDADCSCGTGDWLPDSTFEQTQTNKVKPGQCVIWQLTASNDGTATANDVKITDQTTDYSDFVAAKDACLTSDVGCASPVVNSGTAPAVQWQIGNLASGDSATSAFCVQVQ